MAPFFYSPEGMRRQVDPSLRGPVMCTERFEAIGRLGSDRLVLRAWPLGLEHTLVVADLDACREAFSALGPTHAFRGELRAFLASAAFLALPDLTDHPRGFDRGATEAGQAWMGQGNPRFVQTSLLFHNQWVAVLNNRCDAQPWFALEAGAGRWGEVAKAIRQTFTQPLAQTNRNFNAVGSPAAQKAFAALLLAAVGNHASARALALPRGAARVLKEDYTLTPGTLDEQRWLASYPGWAIGYASKRTPALANRLVEWDANPQGCRRVVFSSRDCVTPARPGRAGWALWEEAALATSTWLLPPLSSEDELAHWLATLEGTCPAADPAFLT